MWATLNQMFSVAWICYQNLDRMKGTTILRDIDVVCPNTHWWQASDLQPRQVALSDCYQWKLETFSKIDLESTRIPICVHEETALGSKSLEKERAQNHSHYSFVECKSYKAHTRCERLVMIMTKHGPKRQQVVHISWCSLLRTNWPSSVALVCTFSCQME